MFPGNRAVVLAMRASHAAHRVAHAAERMQRVPPHAAGTHVSTTHWNQLQQELQSWRVARQQVVQALDADTRRNMKGI